MTERSRVLCPEGDFAVESTDEDELVRIVQNHADAKHDLDLDEGEVRELIEDDEYSAGIE